MIKIFWDKDNFGMITDQLNAVSHSHPVLQIFLSFDAPLGIVVENENVYGKCVIVKKGVAHAFSSNQKTHLSVILEPTSNLASELNCKVKDKNYLVCDFENIEQLQDKAAMLAGDNDKEKYVAFMQHFINYLGISPIPKILDERISELLQVLQTCDCYDHSISRYADKIAISPSRLSHLFREQVGIPLKNYILLYQIERAFLALSNGESITDAAMNAGFDSPSHFAATIKKWMGMSASVPLKDSEFLKVFYSITTIIKVSKARYFIWNNT